METGEMTNLGEWSNGEDVNPMQIIESPFNLPEDNTDACPT
jgi:hypothetical protein